MLGEEVDAGYPGAGLVLRIFYLDKAGCSDGCVLHLTVSVRTGTVSASLMLK